MFDSIKRLLTVSDDERQRDYWETDPGIRNVHHPIVEGFSRQRWDHVGELLPLDEIHTAIDVGAGNGFSTAYAPPHLDTVACDGSTRYLGEHPGKKRVLSNALELPFEANSFDLAYCWELLHHVESPHEALREMARVSRRWVLLFEPNPLNPAQAVFSVVDREHHWVLRYSERYVREQLSRAGLRPYLIQRVGLIFPNRTPEWLYPLLRALPFRWPMIGISLLVIAEKR
ncbi:MAG: class I SAM-dependent methyltransferase [Deltaproteobacteria bacterium]|nr:class I SAM-dependent methyltransferase [Deltaproteobacteria bacterium]